MVLPERQITPILTDDEYNKLKFCYLTAEMGRNEIEPNIVYKCGDQLRFLLLPEAISGAAWLKATLAARAAYPNKGSRKADGQKYGRKLTLGWMKLRYPGYDNMRTAPTLEQPGLVAAFYPLLREMDTLVENAVPDYHKYAWKAAMNAIRLDDEKDDLSRVADSHGLNVVEALDPWNMFYTIRGTVFSTVEFNHNIVFKAHEDGHNVDGTCVCITTLDSYAGGRLVFPRYGYSAELGPRDLLLCDNNHELHGNLGPIVGDRFSVVAFLHDSVMGRAHDGWDGTPGAIADRRAGSVE